MVALPDDPERSAIAIKHELASGAETFPALALRVSRQCSPGVDPLLIDFRFQSVGADPTRGEQLDRKIRHFQTLLQTRDSHIPRPTPKPLQTFRRNVIFIQRSRPNLNLLVELRRAFQAPAERTAGQIDN